MGTGIGLRFYLFEADGSLRRLSTRVADGLIRGEDRLPQYAGQRLRFALAILLLDGGRPASVDKVEGSWWEFGADGSVRRGRFDALREALGSWTAAATSSSGTGTPSTWRACWRDGAPSGGGAGRPPRARSPGSCMRFGPGRRAGRSSRHRSRAAP
jgi:hypothetical protein